jgi:hypothetical protein
MAEIGMLIAYPNQHLTIAESFLSRFPRSVLAETYFRPMKLPSLALSERSFPGLFGS